ncbi:hypothetical protein [Pedobacter sp. AK017]
MASAKKAGDGFTAVFPSGNSRYGNKIGCLNNRTGSV